MDGDIMEGAQTMLSRRKIDVIEFEYNEGSIPGSH